MLIDLNSQPSTVESTRLDSGQCIVGAGPSVFSALDSTTLKQQDQLSSQPLGMLANKTISDIYNILQTAMI